MRLFIDNKEVDIDSNTSLSISISIASITTLDKGRTNYAKSFRIPATAKNMAIFSDVSEIHSIDVFNRNIHPARIEADGCTVINGIAMIAKYEIVPQTKTLYYVINIIGPGKEWIKIATENMFNSLGIAYSKVLNGATISQSWTDSSAVKYFPVQRDTLSAVSGNIQGSMRILTIDDYHPFINLKQIMDTIAAQGGYTISSEFMNGEFFRSLYMSGKYTEKDVDGIKEKMGFKARRSADKTATADNFGRVYADPWMSTNSIGNIVDTANPSELTDSPLSDVYNTNNVFQNSGEMILFKPLESVNIGFEYFLKYKTDYKIKSRSELKCFNRVYLDDYIEREYKVMNKNVDRRSSFKDKWGYRLIVFDHVVGDTYQFTYDLVTNPNADLNNLKPSDYQTIILKTFDTRTTTIETNHYQRVTNPKLNLKTTSGNYISYTGDWALYDGSVTETGKMDIEITVRSGSRTVVPSMPAYFNLVHFGGADTGMSITVSKETSLKPIFIAHPSEGKQVTFDEIAVHEIHQIDVVNALKHMFNLYFYTDSLTKTIYIEPREQFYGQNIVDWSEKMDLSRPISVEEIGTDTNEQIIFRYQEGDGSVARWNEAFKQIMGQWKTVINNLFAKGGTKSFVNPIFTPTLSKTNVYADAPDASLIQVGDRYRKGVKPDTENLNFPAKIVRMEGMMPLPVNSWWGWPSYGAAYPKIAFHNTTDQPFTLCFEDRDDITGLHSYYDKTIELYNQGKKITAYINLNPEDIEPLIIPNDLRNDFRALFRLKIDGEYVMCRLEEITDYNPNRNGSTKCIFIKNI